MNAGFYRAFEDRHRGPRETIKERLRVYLPFMRGLLSLHPQGTVVDLGCGRGEWLELLQTEGVTAQGVDLDPAMLQSCRDLGLHVQQGDAVNFLEGLPDESQMAVSGFHLSEHLPFEVLQLLVAQALRVLRPGGLLILETPNPENLAVGTSGFYTDPTHTRPLPPALLEFLPEFCGFARVKTLRLQQSEATSEGKITTLAEVLTGVSPDYAVIAQKAGAPAAAMAQLESAFSRPYGVTLNELCDRYDQQWARRVQELEQMLLESLQERGGFHGIQRLTWSAARTLRWVRQQRVALREQGVLERLSRLGRKLARDTGRLVARLRFGAGAMTPAARRVHDEIKRSARAQDASRKKEGI